MSKGVIYVASGRGYLKEAKVSARSVKNNSNLKVALFTDKKENLEGGVFDRVFFMQDPTYRSGDKIKCMKKSPFDKTLFLDTDTYVCGDILEDFEILNRFDIALPYAPNRVNEEPLEDIPDSIPELNTGVVMFNSSKKTKVLFDKWEDKYKIHMKKGISIDQASFRESIYNTHVNYHVLPPEYNMRFENVSVGFVSGEVKILHGRRNIETLNKFINIINRTKSNRAWEIEGDSIKVTHDKETIYRRIKTNLSYIEIKNKIKREFRKIFQK